MSATLEEVVAALRARDADRERDGELLDDVEAAVRAAGDGAVAGALERARRAAVEFDRASAAAARARRDLADALEALAAPALQPPTPGDAFRPAAQTRKVRAVPKPDGEDPGTR